MDIGEGELNRLGVIRALPNACGANMLCRAVSSIVKKVFGKSAFATKRRGIIREKLEARSRLSFLTNSIDFSSEYKM